MPRSTAGFFTTTTTAIPSPHSILGLDPKAHITRRWYYFIPATGEPRKLVHRIEQGRLDSLPGAKTPVLQLAGIARGPRESPPKPEEDRHAVLAQQRHHVCLHGRCRHRRISALARQSKSSAPPISSASLKPSSPPSRSPATPSRSAPSTRSSPKAGRRLRRRLRPRSGIERVAEPHRVRHGALAQRSHAPRRPRLGKRAQRQRQRQ